jgi:peroxiredoxin Q/BCP
MKTTRFFLSLISTLILTGCASTQAGSPKVGDKAPLVAGKDQDGHKWKLSDDIGRKVVLLYFYPKDGTPGCTREACGFRDRMATLKDEGVEVVGISFDNETSHKNFIFKYSLNFPLIADTDGQIADAYGVRRETGVKMDRRVSFLIALDGRIVHITDSPSAEVHLTEMEDAAGKLPKS